jgi:hypothetical protein
MAGKDLKAEMVVAHGDKKGLEEQYLAQIIAVSASNCYRFCYICCYNINGWGGFESGDGC